MIPWIATIICFLATWQLFRLNREKEVHTSAALWIPVLWFFIASSRNVSQWLQYSSAGGDQYLEGSPLDRAVLSGILALGVGVLFSRGRRIGKLLRSNGPVLLYFLYCGVSVLWSDFPDVSFKRWFRASGDVVMVLIVLSDPDWLAAIRRLLTRVGTVVVPMSILFIRYFPQMGRAYTRAGAPTWTGVATDKNGLGMICLVFGLMFIFRFLQVLKGEAGTGKRRLLLANGSLIVMTCYLLWEANSATAFACFFLACLPMILTYLFRFARKPAIVSSLVLTALVVPISAMFLGVGSNLVQDLGRNSTFTGRTIIWHSAFGLVHNPLLGTGFESFWVGPRQKEMMRLIDQGVNQAHNGYIEIYLNLGYVGLILLAFLLLTGYRRIAKSVRMQTNAGNLRLAYFIVAIVYNLSEAGFKMMHPVWITLLLATMVEPETPLSSYSPPVGLDHLENSSERKLVTAKSFANFQIGEASAISM